MNKQELDELYFAALEADDAGDYETSLEMFRRGADFGDDGACNAIGLAYYAGNGVEQNKELAIEWFKRAYNDGKNVNYCGNIASTYAEIGELEQAEQWWLRAVDMSDKSAHLEYAQFLMKLERPVSHRQVADLVAVAANAQARMEVAENEKHEAQWLLRDLRRHRVSGNAQRTREDRVFDAGGEAAIAFFEDVLRNDARNVRAHFFLMLLALTPDEEDVPEALRHARAIRHINPGEPNLHLNFGRIYASAGTDDLAIAHYKRALAVQPNDDFVLFCLGKIYFARHQWNKAAFYFERVRGSIEWEMVALHQLWRIHDNTGDIEKERTVYRRMLENNPYDELALQNMGATYLDTRDYARALDFSERAEIEDPNNPMIKRNLVRAKRGLKNSVMDQ